MRIGAPLGEWPAAFFHVDDNIRRRETLLTPLEPGVALDAAIARGRQGMMDEMKRSNLRGRGGAGFPTGDEVRGRPQRAGRAKVHRLQRRRGRARNLQGPRSAQLLLHSRARRHGDRGLRRSARPRASSICAASTSICRSSFSATSTRCARADAWGRRSAARRASISTSRSTWAPAATSAARARR